MAGTEIRQKSRLRYWTGFFAAFLPAIFLRDGFGGLISSVWTAAGLGVAIFMGLSLLYGRGRLDIEFPPNYLGYKYPFLPNAMTVILAAAAVGLMVAAHRDPQGPLFWAYLGGMFAWGAFEQLLLGRKLKRTGA